MCVLTLPQLKREPIDADPGGNDRQCAATLGQCTDLGLSINAEDRAVLFWFVGVSIALAAMRKWILYTRLKPATKARRRGVPYICPVPPSW